MPAAKKSTAKKAAPKKAAPKTKGKVISKKTIKDETGTTGTKTTGTWYVASVIDKRGSGANLEYKIHWEGYPSSDDTWRKAADVTPDAIKEFEAASAPKKSPSGKATLRRNTTLAETVKGTPGKLRAVSRSGFISPPKSPAAKF